MSIEEQAQYFEAKDAELAEARARRIKLTAQQDKLTLKTDQAFTNLVGSRLRSAVYGIASPIFGALGIDVLHGYTEIPDPVYLATGIGALAMSAGLAGASVGTTIIRHRSKQNEPSQIPDTVPEDWIDPNNNL